MSRLLLGLLLFAPLSALTAAEADDARALNGTWKG